MAKLFVPLALQVSTVQILAQSNALPVQLVRIRIKATIKSLLQVVSAVLLAVTSLLQMEPLVVLCAQRGSSHPLQGPVIVMIVHLVLSRRIKDNRSASNALKGNMALHTVKLYPLAVLPVLKVHTLIHWVRPHVPIALSVNIKVKRGQVHALIVP